MTGRNDFMYLKLLQSLLPKGKIWNKENSSTIGKLLHGLAGEYARIEQRVFDLFTESLISQAGELIADYESDYGLYEENIELGKTTEERIQSIIGKLLEYGSTDKNYFIEIAAGLGYTIIIEEFVPAICDVVVCGDPVGHLSNLFWWKVWIVIEEGINYNIERIIQEFDKFKPSHTLVLFDFYGKAFGEGFSSAFDAQPYFDNSWGGNGYGQIGADGLDFGREFDSSFANAYDYDGNNYVGAFHYAFSIDFDRYSGGEFSAEEFSIEFAIPH